LFFCANGQRPLPIQKDKYFQKTTAAGSREQKEERESEKGSDK